MVEKCDPSDVDLSAPAVRSRLTRITSLCGDHAAGTSPIAADALALITEAVAIVRELVPAAGFCALTIDPVTLLHTGLFSPALTTRRLVRQLLECEYGAEIGRVENDRAENGRTERDGELDSASTGRNRAENRHGPYEAPAQSAADPASGFGAPRPRHGSGPFGPGAPAGFPPARRGAFAPGDTPTYAALARAEEQVVCPAESPGSARYRRVLSPAGFHRELTAILRDGGDTWGAFTLWRGAGSAEFTPDEQAVVRAVVPPLAEGVRRALLRVSTEGIPGADAARAAEPLAEDDQAGPGLVLLTVGPTLEADVATSATAAWIAEINDATVCGVPSSLVGAALRAVSSRHEVRFQLCGTSGQWLEINVTPLSTHRAAVIIQPCHPWASARIIARAYGLSPREQEVALLVLRGRRTKEIASALFVSPYTVQDHLKRIFHKTGARSRAELVGRVFFGCALPRQVDGPAEARFWDGPGVVVTSPRR